MEPTGHNMKPAGFTSASHSLAGVGPEGVAGLLSATSDISLVIDSRGTIQDVAFSSADLARELPRLVPGAKWPDTVTIESRIKIEETIAEANGKAPSRWRQINFPVKGGADIPVRISAMRFADGKIIVVGRELRAMAHLQQRLAEAQQAMEREYARIRNAEKRYRLLFQLASEPVIVVDASSLRVIETNPSAGHLIGKDPRKLAGAIFNELFEDVSQQAVQSFAAALRVTPRVDNVHVELTGSREPVLLSGSLFRQDSASLLLVVLTKLAGRSEKLPADKVCLLQAVENSPDGYVVTDQKGRIVTCNSSFVDLVQAATVEQVRGESLERWIGRPAVDMEVLFANLRSHGSVRQYSTIVRGEFGAMEDIEVSGALVQDAAEPRYAFAMRAAGPRSHDSREKLGGRELPKTAEQFTELVGRVPLKSLVRETTDLIERLCIEAALELTKDNRASAAEMLGLSRQGLYAKLRRYGLGDLDGETDGVDFNE